MNKQKGFTIIELIVVIAIIAVLAAIVLVNVTQYISKGKNAAIVGNMATLLTNGAAYFDQNSAKFGSDFVGDNATGCGATGPIALAIKNAQGNVPTCFGKATTQEWCGSSPTLAVGATAVQYFCVDSTGYKGTTAAASACASAHFTCQ